MADESERGYWMDTEGNLMPAEDVPFGWVMESAPGPAHNPDGLVWGKIRPATKEEAEGCDATT